ncbi:hypothetical protein ABIA33_003642 [Streptacidiphilus sp. MAP12-16]|uniref:peptidase n=1 Tax=Streptacidiphilus sp. MAP12-16 TaxID=3156300 RepID=UPI0035158A11
MPQHDKLVLPCIEVPSLSPRPSIYPEGNVKIPMRLAIKTSLAAACIATALPAQAHAASGAAEKLPTRYSAAQILQLTPAQQGAYLAPLRALAGALDGAGRGTSSGIYTNVIIDAPNYQVDLLVTEPAKAKRLIDAARHATPSINTTLVKIQSARYTRKQLDAARDQLANQYSTHQLAYNLISAAPDPHGASLLVSVDDVAKARATVGNVARSMRQSAVPIVFSSGTALSGLVGKAPARTPSAVTANAIDPYWAGVRWHDSSPFIAGDQLVTVEGYCTAGIPAMTTDGHNTPVLLTAGHCVKSSAVSDIQTGNGKAGFYYNPVVSGGNEVGFGGGSSVSDQWDATEIVGQNYNADESDTTTYKKITSVAYSYDGDFVCQDGAYSFFAGQGVPCNIGVTNQDVLYWHANGSGVDVQSRGVQGRHLISYGGQWEPSGWAGHSGDSGGLVFSLSGGNTQARGQVSAGADDTWVGQGGDNTIYWTEAPDILGHYNLKLNPNT